MRRQSAEYRYLLARLRPLGRPIVWSPLIGLAFLGLLTWDYWSGFNGMPFSNNASSRTNRAVSTNLDSPRSQMQNTGINPFTGLLKSPADLDGANPNPTAPTASADALTQSSSTNASKTVAEPQLGLPNATVPLTPTAPASPAPLPENQLESAMSRIKSASPAPSSNAGATSSVYGTAPIEGTTSTNRAPVNSYSNIVEGSESLPTAPNSTPDLTPPTVENAVPSGQSSVESSPNFATTQNNSEMNSQPFTAPQATPGRFIGGGSINTFSNP